MNDPVHQRTIIVGDIHGCYDELIDLLNKVNLTNTDRLISVGDLITKGPRNRDVLDLFISDARFSAVLGNQDLAVLNRLEAKDFDYSNPQKETAEELEVHREKYVNFLSSLPRSIDLGSQLVVHAGVRPGVPLSEQAESDLLELRTLGKNPTKRHGTPWYEVYEGHKFVLFGHWPRRQVRRGPMALGIDTGCVYGNRLTAYVAETGELLSVPARQSYSRASQEFYDSEPNSDLPSDQTLSPLVSTESIHA